MGPNEKQNEFVSVYSVMWRILVVSIIWRKQGMINWEWYYIRYFFLLSMPVSPLSTGDREAPSLTQLELWVLGCSLSADCHSLLGCTRRNRIFGGLYSGISISKNPQMILWGINRDLRIHHILRNEKSNNTYTYLSWIFSRAILMSLCVIFHWIFQILLIKNVVTAIVKFWVSQKITVGSCNQLCCEFTKSSYTDWHFF